MIVDPRVLATWWHLAHLARVGQHLARRAGGSFEVHADEPGGAAPSWFEVVLPKAESVALVPVPGLPTPTPRAPRPPTTETWICHTHGRWVGWRGPGPGPHRPWRVGEHLPSVCFPGFAVARLFPDGFARRPRDA